MSEYEFPGYTPTHHRTSYAAISPTNKANSAEGKVVLITGGGIGIGRSIAKAFVQAGAKTVVILGRRENVLLEAKKELESEAGTSTKILTFTADVLDEAALDSAFQQVGPIDVCVANAGYLSSPAPAATADLGDYWKAFEINIKGTLLTFRAFVKNKSAKQPAFIALNTAGAHAGAMPQFSSYGSSKIALAQLISYLAAENPDVAVHQFHPGILESEMNVKSGLPLTKDDLSLPSDFAVWLASPAAAWTSGRFLWAHWDVEELAERKDEILASGELQMALAGWPKIPKPNVVG